MLNDLIYIHLSLLAFDFRNNLIALFYLFIFIRFLNQFSLINLQVFFFHLHMAGSLIFLSTCFHIIHRFF